MKYIMEPFELLIISNELALMSSWSAWQFQWIGHQCQICQQLAHVNFNDPMFLQMKFEKTEKITMRHIGISTYKKPVFCSETD
jgi:hypothetical protein